MNSQKNIIRTVTTFVKNALYSANASNDWEQPWVKIIGNTPIQVNGTRPYNERHSFILSAQTNDLFFVTKKQIEKLAEEERDEADALSFCTPEERTKYIQENVSFILPFQEECPRLVESWFSVKDTDENGAVKIDKNGDEKTRLLCREVEVYWESQYHSGKILRERIEKIKSTQQTKRTEYVTNEEHEQALRNIIDYINVDYKQKVINQAFYSPSPHSVTIPETWFFKSLPSYYATAFHELAHATKWWPHAVPREWGASETTNAETGEVEKITGKERNREELLAEITSLMAWEYFGTSSPETRKNSIEYIKNWLSSIKTSDQEKYIFDSFQKSVKCLQVFLDANKSILELETIPETEEIKYNEARTCIYLSGDWSFRNKEVLKAQGFKPDTKTFGKFFWRNSLQQAKNFYNL